MSFLAATALAAVTANICLGAFVLLYRRARLVNQLFFAFSICLAAWCFTIYMLANPVGEVVAVLSARFMIYSSLLASVVFLHLVLRLFGSPSRLHLLHRAHHLCFCVCTLTHPRSPYLRPIIGLVLRGLQGEGHWGTPRAACC